MYRYCLILGTIVLTAMILLTISCTTTGTEGRNVPESPFESISASLLLGDPGKAIKSYEEAFKNNPKDIGTRVLHARLLILAARYEEARNVLADILKEAPENPDALFAMALLEGAQGNTEKQKEMLQAILAKHPDHEETVTTLAALLLDDRQDAKAKELFLRAETADKKNIVVLLGLGNIAYREKRYQDSKAYLDRAIESDPTYPFSYADRAKARRQLNDDAGALEDLNKAIELDPDYAYSYYDRGRVYIDLGEKDKAIAEFTTGIQKDPGIFILYVMRAGLYEEKSQNEQAIADYRKAIQLKPEYYFSYSSLGTLYYLTGRFQEAAGMFNKAWEFEKMKFEYALMAANALKRSGAEKDALALCNERVKDVSTGTWQRLMFEYYLNPSKDFTVLNAASQEKNEMTRPRIYFYIALEQLAEGKNNMAVTSFSKTMEIEARGIMEKRIAQAEMTRLVK
jgi:tetratricopeptide (TPR) repeat protein